MGLASPGSQGLQVRGVLAVAGLLGLVVFIGYFPSGPEGVARQAVAPMFDTARWSEARVSADGPASPCVPQLADTLPDQCTDVLSDGDTLSARNRAWELRPRWTGHHAALWSLATETAPTRSVAKFEAQLGDNPSDPALWNDLAAAYYNARRHREDWRALESSLAALEQSLAYGPQYARALYNRALVLEDLGLMDAAADAWQAYLGRAERDDWRLLAQRRLAALQRSIQAMEEISEQDIPFGGSALDLDLDASDRTVRRRLRSELIGALLDRGELFQDLGDRAASVCEGGSVERRRALVELERGASDGPSLLEDTFAWLCAEDTPARAQALARLGDAAAAYKGIGPDRSEALATAAHAALVATESPLTSVARLIEGQSRFAQEHYRELASLRAMEAALKDATDSPYAVVAARAFERLGSAALRRARSEEALNAYRRGEALLGDGQDVARAARIRALLANTLSSYGRHDRAWQTIIRALAQARAEAFPRTAVLTVCEMGAIAALMSDAPQLHNLFADCAVRKLRERDDPSLRTSIYLLRGVARQRLGWESLATADFEASRAAARDSIEPREALLNHTIIDLEQSRSLIDTAPERTLIPMQRALEVYQANGNRVGEFRARYGLIEAHEALGDAPAAAAQRDALVPFLAEALQAKDPAVTRWRYQHDRVTYEQQVRSQVRRGRYREALATLVRLRQPNRFAGKSVQAIIEAARPRPPAAANREELTFIFAWLGDAIAVWRIDVAGELTFYEAVVEEGAAAPWRALVAHAADTSAAPLAGGRATALTQLYDALLRPGLAGVAPNTRLHLVPDGPLYGLPWPALRDRRSQRYLVEQFPFDVVVELRAQGEEPAHDDAPSWRHVAVFADPQAARSRPLPAVAEDVQVIHEALGAQGAAVTHYAGDALTREAFEQALYANDLVHYSGHGTVDVWDPSRSRLVLRADADGVVRDAVTAGQLEALGAARGGAMPALVVLAACDTAAYSDRLPHSVALVRPLLEAGTREVMGALRPLPDKDYHAIIERFYAGLSRGESPVDALTSAQRHQSAQAGVNAVPGEVQAWQFVQLYRFE